jgi:hypothetical protein
MSGGESQRMSDAHRECWESLPWLVNERLSAKEAGRIGRHLQQCSECRVELETQQHLRDAIRGGDDPLVLAPQAGLQRLMSRIDADETREPELATTNDKTVVSPIRPMTARRRPWLAIAAAVQTVTIGVLLGGLWWVAQEPRFIGLVSQATVVPEGPVLRVVFADNVSVGEVNQLLREIGAQVVSGPSEDAGVYTLALRERGRQDPAAALARLRADAHVIFAERAIAQVEGR